MENEGWLLTLLCARRDDGRARIEYLVDMQPDDAGVAEDQRPEDRHFKHNQETEDRDADTKNVEPDRRGNGGSARVADVVAATTNSGS